MKRKPDPELIDEDSPEADAGWFAKARPAPEALPELFGAEAAEEMLQPRRGRPRLESPKQHVNLRIDSDVLSAFRATGRGWQTRLNDALKDWLKDHSPA